MLIAEAVAKASEHIEIDGKTLVDCIHDMKAYTKLDDSLIFKVFTIKTKLS